MGLSVLAAASSVPALTCTSTCAPKRANTCVQQRHNLPQQRRQQSLEVRMACRFAFRKVWVDKGQKYRHGLSGVRQLDLVRLPSCRFRCTTSAPLTPVSVFDPK